jgi:AraC-like DNA-binding protein
VEISRVPHMYAGYLVRKPVEDFPALTHCGEASYAPSHSVPWDIHSVFEFTYTMRGASSLHFGRQTVISGGPGDVLIAHPRERHAMNLATNQKVQILWMGLDLKALGSAGVELAEKLRRRRLHLIRGAYDIEPILRGLVRQVLSREAGYGQVVRAQVQLTVALLGQRIEQADVTQPQRLRQSLEAVPDKPGKPMAVVFSSDPPYTFEIAKAIGYMRQNLGKRLSMKEVAAASGYSIWSLFHRFRNEVGTSPHAYHLDLRLEAAKDALIQPDASVLMVSQMFGFSSSQHFSTAFANSFGLSPTAWRAKYLKEHSRGR